MSMLRNHLGILGTVSFAVLTALACGDDEKSSSGPNGTADGGPDAGMNGNAGNGGAGGANNGGNGGNAGDDGDAGDAGDGGSAGADNDAGDNDASTPTEVVYLIPSGGGEVELTVGDTVITFAFPASAAGEEITLSVAQAGDIGWEADDFSVVIEMQPDGLQFDDPVIVTPSTGELIAMTFPQSSTQSAPEQLPLASDGSGFELTHFSYLTFGSLVAFCESSGVTETPNAQQCVNEGSASTLRTFHCNRYRFCSITDAYCCVEPGDAGGDDCLLPSSGLIYSFNSVRDVTGDYPYCGAVEDDGGTVDPDGGGLPDGSTGNDAGDGGGFLTCNEAIAAVAGPGPNPLAVACPNAGGFPAACVAAIAWEPGISCNEFCATMGLSCIYNGEANGTNSGIAECSDTFLQPTPTVTSWCGVESDADHWCHCD